MRRSDDEIRAAIRELRGLLISDLPETEIVILGMTADALDWALGGKGSTVIAGMRTPSFGKLLADLAAAGNRFSDDGQLEGARGDRS